MIPRNNLNLFSDYFMIPRNNLNRFSDYSIET